MLWENFVGTVAGALSAMTALTAVTIAVRSESRSRKVAAAEMYLSLRSRFLELYPRLGDVEQPPATEDQRLARVAYWHQLLDEWYISTRFAPDEFGDLWDDFYKKAGQTGLNHVGLRTSLQDLIATPNAGFPQYAGDFLREMGIDAVRRPEAEPRP
jgi:hypothetical protein